MRVRGSVRRARARRGAGLGVALAVVLVVSGCAAAGTWAVNSPPTKGADHVAGFEDVSCASASQCLAVGTYQDSGVSKVLAETWDGTQWAAVADLPIPAGSTLPTRANVVVDCATAQACIGATTVLVSGVATPIAASWDGGAWTPTALAPTVAGAGVDDVSCASAASCVLVGDEGPTPTINRSQYAQRWNGTSWASVAAPIPSPENSSPLDVRPALSCPTATACTLANGWTTPAAQMGTTVERFDGTSWTVAPDPPIGGVVSTPPVLLSIDCAAPTSCVGVGFRQGGSAILSFDGTTWQDQSPLLAFVLPLVSCASVDHCLAVGPAADNPSPGASVGGYALTGPGSGWGSTTAPADPGARLVTGVSCVPGTGTATVCVVAGRNTTGTSTAPFALRFSFG